MSIQALREQRAAKAKALNDLLTANPDTWGPELQATYDAGIDEIDQIDGKINRQTALNERAAKDVLDGQLIEAGERGARDKQSPSAAIFSKWLRGGDQALSAEDIATIRNTMSTTTGAEGGFAVQKDVAKTIVDALKAFGGVRQSRATVLSTDMGNPIDYPTSDGTSEIGEQLAENAAAAATDPGFGVVNLTTYKFSSRSIAVPIELLQDSSVDIEAFVRLRMAQRLGRVTNQRFTAGTGTGQPQGIVTAAASGVVGATGTTASLGASGAVAYDNLVTLQHSVDPAYRQRGREWMMHDSTLREVRKLKDGQSRPIFVPGYEAGVPGGMPDTLLGDTIVINQDMPVMAANAKSVLFGDFSPFVIRDVMAMMAWRMTDSAFALKGQVGFVSMSRHGSVMTDVGGAVKYYQNSAT